MPKIKKTLSNPLRTYVIIFFQSIPACYFVKFEEVKLMRKNNKIINS